MYRKITDWEWYTDANTFRVFFHLLVSAAHRDIKFKGIELKRGQVITGRMSLAKELGLSEMQIRTVINRLKSTNEITIKATSKYSVVTIVNYDTYQAKPSDEQPAKEPAVGSDDNQVATTYNNVKNEKKVKNVFIEPSGKDVSAYMEKIGLSAECASNTADEFIDHHSARGWLLSNGKKMVDWKAAVRTWIRNKNKWSGLVVIDKPDWSHMTDAEWYKYYDQFRYRINCPTLNGVPMDREQQEENLRDNWHKVSGRWN